MLLLVEMFVEGLNFCHTMANLIKLVKSLQNIQANFILVGFNELKPLCVVRWYIGRQLNGLGFRLPLDPFDE